MNNNENNKEINQPIKVVESIREIHDSQTSGLTYQITAYVKDVFRTKEGLNIFTIDDGQDTFKLTKFVPGGVAYEDIKVGSVATFQFTRKNYEGSLQGRSVQARLASEVEEAKVKEARDAIDREQFKPKNEELLIDSPHYNTLKPSLIEAATIIRHAIISRRPIIVSHHNDCDGYSAGLLLENAIVPMIEEHHPLIRYMANYFMRNPSRTPWYDIIDVTKDIGTFLQNEDRANTTAPLILIVDNGSSEQDLLAIKKAKLFGAQVMVIDHHYLGELDSEGKSAVCKETVAHVNPHLNKIDDNFSAAMICYQLAHYINEKVQPKADIAAMGAVADRCETSEVEQLLNKAGFDREYAWRLGRVADFEIFNTKLNQARQPLLEFMQGTSETIREDFLALYEPIMLARDEQVKASVMQYAKQEQMGKYKLFSLDGELASMRGDYYSLGKLAGMLFGAYEDEHNPQARVIMVHSNAMMTFRVEPDEQELFDVNKLIAVLKEKLPAARIDGGGHALAGSIKFLPIAKEEVMNIAREYIANL